MISQLRPPAKFIHTFLDMQESAKLSAQTWFFDGHSGKNIALCSRSICIADNRAENCGAVIDTVGYMYTL